jgi:CheY-like chemotaxis protein
MAKQRANFTILMADDDADDCLLAQDALREAGLPHGLQIVRDGQQLLDYLRQQGEYRGDAPSSPVAHAAPRPDLILLDLKMPRMDGREALSELKADPRLRSIPIVVLTTSTARDDISYCYRMGVNSYLTKPSTYRGLVDLLATICKYWFELAELPVVE